MDGRTDVGSALRDLFRAHVRAHIWLPALLMLVAAVSLGTLVRAIMHLRSGPVYPPPELGAGVAYSAILSWTVSTVCAYVGGFVMGRLYVPGV
jgi:hypothetical protein